MSFSPAFNRPLPRIEASLRWRTNKERLFRSTAIRETLVWRAGCSQQCNQLRQGFSAPSARRGSFVRQAIAPGGEFNNENTTTGHAILKSPLSKSASI
jgi:hypothetical protein